MIELGLRRPPLLFISFSFTFRACWVNAATEIAISFSYRSYGVALVGSGPPSPRYVRFALRAMIACFQAKCGSCREPFVGTPLVWHCFSR